MPQAKRANSSLFAQIKVFKVFLGLVSSVTPVFVLESDPFLTSFPLVLSAQQTLRAGVVTC